MKIVRPSAIIVESSHESLTDALKKIEYAARISHGSEDQAGADPEKFIRAIVLQHGDWSVVEHVSVSVEFLVDRGVSHELVRHRLASYTQSSTRFINYAKKMPPSFIYPKPEIECEYCLDGRDAYQHNCPYDTDWREAIYHAERQYRALIEKGWRPQEARSVFPNALSTKIMMTCNIRNWRQVMLMRSTKEAHPQMRQVMIPLLKDFQRLIPVLFEDIIPESRQVDNIAKGR